MKYILPIILIFFLGCSKKEETKNKNPNSTNIQKITKKSKSKNENLKTVVLKDLNLTFKNGKLIYPKKKTVLLFCDNSKFSKAQKVVLKKLKIPYETTDDKFLENYFHIKIYPTIIVLDKNKTIKYENFVPYEILKTEGF